MKGTPYRWRAWEWSGDSMLRVVKNVESYSPSKGGFILPRVFGPSDLCGTVGLW